MRRLSAAVRAVESQLGDAGRVLVRWSGTEPKLRIMVEGPDEAAIRAWIDELAQAARSDVPE
jgi:phosphoglucosamine mutase